MEFILALIIGFVIDVVLAAFIVFVLNIVGIPALAALSLWQVFGLLVVADVVLVKTKNV